MSPGSVRGRGVAGATALRSPACKASHEDDAFPDCVIDPEFIDLLALRQEPGAAAILKSALDELRPTLLEQLAANPGGRRLASVSAQVEERFERAASIIEKSRTAGLPRRVEMAAAGAIAALVGANRAMAKRAVQIFDLVPGFNASPEERLPAAAAAWVRLDAAKAKQLAQRFNEGTGAVVAKRWSEIARAHMAWPGRNPAIAAMIPESALGAAAKNAPVEITRPLFESLLRKARNSAELAAAVAGASASGDQALLPVILEKLRDVPFRIDKALEALLVPLMGPENEDRVRDEIDGENPFRDRREALARALAVSRERGRSKG